MEYPILVKVFQPYKDLLRVKLNLLLRKLLIRMRQIVTLDSASRHVLKIDTNVGPYNFTSEILYNVLVS